MAAQRDSAGLPEFRAQGDSTPELAGVSSQRERRLWLIEALKHDMPEYAAIATPADEAGQRRLLRSLMNVRPPRPAPAGFLEVQDAYLKARLVERGVFDSASLIPTKYNSRIYLWKGDITTIKIGAIVNAANSALLGCFEPCHACIDNCIHTFAGIQLRFECAQLMREQGRSEPTGKAKITAAYNLPCEYVIHTVGPIIQRSVTDKAREQLAGCYRSSLRAADSRGADSIAFCCISTGVFHFPNNEAAEIAVRTVMDYLDENQSPAKVVFNVFSDRDFEIYNSLLN